MRKKYFYLLMPLIIISCDTKEDETLQSASTNNATQTYIINGDIEYISEIFDGSKPTRAKLVYDIPKIKTENNIINTANLKTSEQSVSINFGYGLGDPTNSGCVIKRYNDGNSYYTDAGVFGSTPYPYPNLETKSYLVRGYGLPHLNLYYGSLVLFVSNKGKKTYTRQGQVWHENDPSGSAISIEYPFKANTTYEISINVSFHDNRYLIDKVYSNGYPTIYVQLKNDGIIQIPNIRSQSQDPCDKNGLNSLDNYASNYVNYTRSYTLDSRAVIQRTLTFKFSPTEEKKALLISLHPALSNSGPEAPISTNNYTMRMPLITINEKPFDPSLNVPIINTTNPRR